MKPKVGSWETFDTGVATTLAPPNSARLGGRLNLPSILFIKLHPKAVAAGKGPR
ncbi:MAG: hypothetical protein ACR2OZ_20845 [Verrucomicrobiales bacterium]